ncbi:hypothetical protein GY45DRAFT_1417811 [Cubamyces sp. BRFM 1775]|nr:hypothetical protein GY45DRAFT_1417811 [Cubamyces sp. BRFM 1775]
MPDFAQLDVSPNVCNWLRRLPSRVQYHPSSRLAPSTLRSSSLLLLFLAASSTSRCSPTPLVYQYRPLLAAVSLLSRSPPPKSTHHHVPLSTRIASLPVRRGGSGLAPIITIILIPHPPSHPFTSVSLASIIITSHLLFAPATLSVCCPLFSVSQDSPRVQFSSVCVSDRSDSPITFHALLLLSHYTFCFFFFSVSCSCTIALLHFAFTFAPQSHLYMRARYPPSSPRSLPRERRYRCVSRPLFLTRSLSSSAVSLSSRHLLLFSARFIATLFRSSRAFLPYPTFYSNVLYSRRFRCPSPHPRRLRLRSRPR